MRVIRQKVLRKEGGIDMLCKELQFGDWITDNNGFPMRINSGEIPDMLSSVKYVHQLQQILRLYGLNELADNFKV